MVSRALKCIMCMISLFFCDVWQRSLVTNYQSPLLIAEECRCHSRHGRSLKQSMLYIDCLYTILM